MPDTTGPKRGMHPNGQMNIIGWTIVVLMLPLLVPLIPFFLAFYLVDWLSGEAGGGRRTEASRPAEGP